MLSKSVNTAQQLHTKKTFHPDVQHEAAAGGWTSFVMLSDPWWYKLEHQAGFTPPKAFIKISFLLSNNYIKEKIKPFISEMPKHRLKKSSGQNSDSRGETFH